MSENKFILKKDILDYLNKAVEHEEEIISELKLNLVEDIEEFYFHEAARRTFLVVIENINSEKLIDHYVFLEADR